MGLEALPPLGVNFDSTEGILINNTLTTIQIGDVMAVDTSAVGLDVGTQTSAGGLITAGGNGTNSGLYVCVRDMTTVGGAIDTSSGWLGVALEVIPPGVAATNGLGGRGRFRFEGDVQARTTAAAVIVGDNLVATAPRRLVKSGGDLNSSIGKVVAKAMAGNGSVSAVINVAFNGLSGFGGNG